MLKALLKKPRKGNLVVVVLFAMVIGVISIGTFSVAMTLYRSNIDSADRYAKMQSYRAAAEIAVYQYIKDLESYEVDKTLETAFITPTPMSTYNEAIQTVFTRVGKSDNILKWKVGSIARAVDASGIDNPATTVHLISLLNDGRDSFSLYSEALPELDYSTRSLSATETFISPAYSFTVISSPSFLY